VLFFYSVIPAEAGTHAAVTIEEPGGTTGKQVTGRLCIDAPLSVLCRKSSSRTVHRVRCPRGSRPPPGWRVGVARRNGTEQAIAPHPV